MSSPVAEDYLRLARLYAQALEQPIDPRGSRLELLFSQTIHLLYCRSSFNDNLPHPFLDVAHRISHHDQATIEHFNYDENREFFLSDLFDYVRIKKQRPQQTTTAR